MAKPNKKQKKLLLIVGMTGVVYASFKYLLPLVIPFFIAYIIALALRPSALWLSRHVGLSFGGRRWHLPLALAGGLELLAVFILMGWLLYTGGRKLCSEVQLLIDSLPAIIRRLDIGLTGWCVWIEHSLHLHEGGMVRLMQDLLRSLGRKSKETAMPFLMVNSMSLLRWCAKVTIITVVLFVASVLSLQEMESIRDRRDRSMFRREFAMLSNRLVCVGRAYVKTQAVLLSLIAFLCTVGLFLIGNPYYLLLGILIGLLDALPLFGTGTVLLPWAVFCFIKGEWGRGLILLGLYLLCYFLREILEAKMMGNKVGLSGLESLAAMYVGLQLFGLLGFILGPVGLLLIEDGVDACCGESAAGCREENVD